ncbi:hypothetical protein NMY22_g8739 [Coprinellus aureogranulatus]|nr:hypothetical protein NMY22_g8739 [Coprinellus aureogranulatus]
MGDTIDDSFKTPFTTGRFQFVGSDRYYSPNSALNARLNLHPLQDHLSNPFLPNKIGVNRVRYRDFVDPRPWDIRFGYLAFVPVVPSQWFDPHTYLGRILLNSPPTDHYIHEDGKKTKHGWAIPPENGWRTLEKDLYAAVVALSGHYHVPIVLPFLPNAIGYTEMYQNKRDLTRRVEEALDWLFVWFGVLSFLLAWLRLNPVVGARHALDHEITAVLLSRGVSPTFVDALMTSLIASQDPERVRRAGTIVDVKKHSNYKGHSGDLQPYPDWFTFWGVPVWYTWNSEEEAGSDFIQNFRPPAHLFLPDPPPPPSLQENQSLSHKPANIPPSEEASSDVAMQDPLPSIEVSSPVVNSSSPARSLCAPRRLALFTLPRTTTKCRSWLLSNAPGGSESNAVPGQKEPVSQQEPEWVAFFKVREVDNARRLAVETPQARMARLNRTREPATKKAKVFEWFKTGKGGQWERHPVLGKGKIETLDGYSEAQRRYDPFVNEWDCCSEWGDDKEEEMFDEPPEGNDAPTIPPPAAATFVRVDRPPTPPPTSFIDNDAPTEIFLASNTSSGGLQTEVTETLSHFFGFNSCIPGEPEQPSANLEFKEKVFLLRVIGADPASNDNPYFGTRECLVAQQFVKALCERQNPRPGSWDLLDDCVRPVRLTPRFPTIRLIRLTDKDKVDPHDRVDRYYVFDDTNTDESFKVGVTTAAGAALVCRLSSSNSASDIAAFLSSYGVSFRVFYPSRSIIKPPSFEKIPLQIPKRPFAHKFTKEDYDSYLQMRTLLLGQSHMQAALKRGGIVWRLAVGTLGTSKVAFPPSLWASSHGFDLAGVRFVDDVLTTTEMDLICGAYECISDDGKRRALKSWWPLCRYYEKDECGENYGRWTPRRERWYEKRLKAIEEGDIRQQPYTYTEWKSSHHGPATIRNLHAYIDRTSSQLIESR